MASPKPPRDPSESIGIGFLLTALGVAGFANPIFFAAAAVGGPFLLYGIIGAAVRVGMFWADVDRATFDEQD